LSYLNKLQIIGHLGKDPEEVRNTNGAAKFSVATTRRWKSREGDQQEQTTWHNVVCFNDFAAKFALQYLKKGDLVYVEGAMERRSWKQDDGSEREIVELVVRPYAGEVRSLERRGSGGDSQDREQSRPPRTSSRQQQPEGRRGDLDDEIPF
jgi:single-strand DNA-binding protein